MKKDRETEPNAAEPENKCEESVTEATKDNEMKKEDSETEVLTFEFFVAL